MDIRSLLPDSTIIDLSRTSASFFFDQKTLSLQPGKRVVLGLGETAASAMNGSFGSDNDNAPLTLSSRHAELWLEEGQVSSLVSEKCIVDLSWYK
jgi:hypothetical protein